MAVDVASIFALLERYGYILVFLAGLGEALPLIGLLIPGQAIILLAGALAATDRLSLAWIIAAAIPAGILGDAFTYYLGRSYGRTLLEKYGHRFRIEEKQLARMDQLFDKFGVYALVIARFSFLTRGIGALLAGMSKVRQRVFWPVNVVGAIAWAVVYSVAGYFFGAAYLRLEGALGRILTITLLVSAGLFLLYRVLRRYAEQFTREDLYVALLGVAASTTFGVLAQRLASLGRANKVDAVGERLVEVLEPARGAFALVEPIGSYLVLGVVALGALGLLAWQRRAWEATLIGLGVGGGILLVEILRPALATALDPSVGGTYPGSNAAVAVIFGGSAIYLVGSHAKRAWLPTLTVALAGAFTAVVGLAPVALAREGLTDALGGLMLGIAWLSVCILLVEFGLKRTSAGQRGNGAAGQRGEKP